MIIKRPFVLAAALLMAATIACGGGGVTPSSTLQSITVSPSDQTIASGSSQVFSARGQFSDGSSKDLTAGLSWSASRPSVAIISAGGVATGIGDGTTNISASSSGVTGSTMLIVQSGSPDPREGGGAFRNLCSGRPIRNGMLFVKRVLSKDQ